MTMEIQPAEESELITFLEKLANFHETLAPREQALLDEMTATMLIAPQLAPQGDVQGYINAPSSLQVFTGVNHPSSQYYYYYASVQQYYNTLQQYYRIGQAG